MLTVAKVTAHVAAGYADYLQGKTTPSERGDYYLTDGGERVEAPGRWVGTPLGHEQVVSPRELWELMAVRHPRTGQPLRPVGAGGQAVAALDATFSAPKSVSAAWALSDYAVRVEIEQAHEQAIDRALSYAVSEVAMVRRRIDRETVRHVTAADVVATSWRHTTARAVEGGVPDPQLHSHVLLHAAVREDGQFAAIDSRAWLRHRREIGAAYRTELAHGLARLGYQIEQGTGRGGRYFEIAGMPTALVERWSSRHRQVRATIDARLATGGQPDRAIPSPAEERLAAVTSRASKQQKTIGDLNHHWRVDGERAGVDIQAVMQLRDDTQPRPGPVDPRGLVRALTEFDATFTAREARAAALEQSAGVPIAQALAVLDQAREDGQLLTLADGRHTTAAHRQAEAEVLTSTAALSQDHDGAIDPVHVDAARATLDDRLAAQGGALSGEQRQALSLAAGDRRVVMIEGQAGTGKSTVLQAVALAHQADGRQVIVTSTAALAAQRLAADLTDAGVDASAHSTAALAHRVNRGQVRLDETTTIIHDEAALASTREQHQLLGMVEASGARLVLVGDPQQSQPVGAGGLWTPIQQALEDSGARVELTENLRTRNPEDRRDQARFRSGDHLAAVEGYAHRGRVHISDDTEIAEDAALRAAHADRQAGQQPLVIAQTSNEHLAELNAEAQALRRVDHELGADGLAVAGWPYRLHAGDEIQVRRTITHPSHGPIRNGTTATITEVSPRRDAATLRFGDASAAKLDRRQLEQADIRLAYVQHPFPAQGTTSDTTHLIAARTTTRDGAYVALTRAREATHIYASVEQLAAGDQDDHIERLAELLSSDEPEVPSITTPLADEQHLQPRPAPDPRTAPARVMSAWPRRRPADELERDDTPGFEL